MKQTFGIRTDAEAETAGLDVSEHGMWGYPELFSPVPGGYGTEGSSAPGSSWHRAPAPLVAAVPVPETG
jgi:Amt family ammonium transporter